MALSALLQRDPSYRSVFSIASNGSPPGVRRVQGWIEEAWAQGGYVSNLLMSGFDDQGRVQLQGNLVGTRKWIGVSGGLIATALTRHCGNVSRQRHPVSVSLCALTPDARFVCTCAASLTSDDFPKPKKNAKGKSTHQVLQEWVVAYFNDSSPSASAYDVLMSSSAIKRTDKMPLILQVGSHRQADSSTLVIREQLSATRSITGETLIYCCLILPSGC